MLVDNNKLVVVISDPAGFAWPFLCFLPAYELFFNKFNQF